MLIKRKIVDKEEILEENLKRAFTIFCRQCTESIFSNMRRDRKYEAIESDQEIIGMLKIIKEVNY